METLREIIHSIRQNKVRTFMSGFGIMWGDLYLSTPLRDRQGGRVWSTRPAEEFCL